MTRRVECRSAANARIRQLQSLLRIFLISQAKSLDFSKIAGKEAWNYKQMHNDVQNSLP
jgi:hypothetical protein